MSTSLSPHQIEADAELGFDRRYHAHAQLRDARYPGGYRRARANAATYQESVHLAIERLMRRASN